MKLDVSNLVCRLNVKSTDIKDLQYGAHLRSRGLLKFREISANIQGCSGAGTRWNAVSANILEPERRSGKYRWPQVER